jgi:hypothetical protein
MKKTIMIVSYFLLIFVLGGSFLILQQYVDKMSLKQDDIIKEYETQKKAELDKEKTVKSEPFYITNGENKQDDIYNQLVSYLRSIFQYKSGSDFKNRVYAAMELTDGGYIMDYFGDVESTAQTIDALGTERTLDSITVTKVSESHYSALVKVTTSTKVDRENKKLKVKPDYYVLDISTTQKGFTISKIEQNVNY